MKISLPLYALVQSRGWSTSKQKDAWLRLFKDNFSNFRILEIDKSGSNSLQNTKTKLASELNSLKNTSCYLVDLDRTTPEEFSIFLQESLNSKEPLQLSASGGGRLRNFLAQKLFFGLNAAPYSAIKVLPALICYNLNIRDLSLRSDHSLLHLANILSIEPKFIISKVGKKRQFIHALASKALHFVSPARPAHLPANTDQNMVGAGIIHKGKTFVTHTTLREHFSATNSFTRSQIFTIIAVVSLFILGLIVSPIKTMIGFTAVLSTIYFIDVLFNLFLVGKSIHTPPELSFTAEELAVLKDKDLPIYTILVPLYKEANVLPHFVESIGNMDYPKEKLDVILLLEEDDQETIKVAKSLNLPKFITPLVVPHSFPKTKPKACNYGLSYAKGEYVVIYDAEDQPDPLQLKKAIMGFKVSPPEVGCLQAKLNYHNKDQNLLTRFFTAEYSLWFDVVLPGLQSINTSIPLGGTSNHFRVQDLIAFQGWDAFNVTEDADLGSRLFKAGFRTAIIDSVTLEEANSKVGNWIRQRSRWIKGYMQTFLVHNRNFGKFWKEQGIHALVFQLTVGGKIAFMLINPLLWIATISYFVFYSIVGPTIESFYPTIVFYMAAFSLVFGNFLFIYYYMLGVAKHGHWSLVKYIYLVPIYWLLISRSALKALYQLFLKPHYWEKTIHGLHLKKEEKKKEEPKNKTPKSSNLKIGESLRKAYNHELWGSAMLVTSSIFISFLNFLFNIYLGNYTSFIQFGLISLFSSFFYLTQVPFSIFGSSVTHISAYQFGKQKTNPKHVWRTFRRWGLYLSIFLTVAWIAFTPLLKNIFKGDSLEPFYIFAPIWIIGLLSAIDLGFLRGTHRFTIISLLAIVETIVKIVVSYTFITIGKPESVYLALPFSIFISFIMGWVYVSKAKDNESKEDGEKKVKFPKKFAATNILNKLSLIAFMGLDIVIAKLVLSPVEAGQFALVSLVGKMVYFFSSLTGPLILPMVSKEEGSSGNPIHIFNKIFAITLFFTTISYLGLGIFGWLTVPMLFGSKMVAVLRYLPFYLLGISSFTLASSIIQYHQSRKKYLISIVSFFVALAQLDYLFDSAKTLSEFCYILGIFGIAQFLVVAILHRITRYSTALSQNSYAFFNLFKKQKDNHKKFEGQIRFLILNWRDTKHKWAGGAESYVHELGRNLVEKGHQVTIFCGNDGKNKNREVLDGMEIIRRGGFFMVYVWAAIYYIFKFQDRFDIIIDSENGVPFFTPLYSRRPKFLLMHHVHQEVFNNALKFPLREFAKFLEAKLMPLVYRNEKVMAVSESTKIDVLKLGIFKPENVCIVNPGIELVPLKNKVIKTDYPSLLYLGRLKDYKNVDIAIKSFAKSLKDTPNAIFNIAGEGECEAGLKNLVKELNIESSVNFLGRVSDEDRTNLYASSWLMIQPSSHEGWGITVIEANFYGTPVIASDIAGLRDSVVDGKTGILVKPKSVLGFSKAITKLIKRNSLREKMSAAGLERAKKFNWSENTDIFLSVVERYYIYSQSN